MKKISSFSLLSVLAIAGCTTVSIPIKGVSSDGNAWNGYFTTKDFQLSSGSVICNGKPNLGWGKTNTHSFTCSDGRSGTATTTRTSMRGGEGDVNFSDGSTAKLTYGT